MTFIQAKANLHALSRLYKRSSANATCQSSNIDFDAFRDEGELEVRAEPPLKKRKLGWIPALDETNCDSATLSLLKIEFSIIDDIPRTATSLKDSRITNPIKVILESLEESDHHVYKFEFSSNKDTTATWSGVFGFTKENGITEPLKELLEVQKQIDNVRQLREILNLQSSIQLSPTEYHIVHLELRLLWKVGASVFDLAGSKWVRQTAFSILETYFPDACRSSPSKWRPQDFYENVHVPSATSPLLSQSQNATLGINLYPFQQRAVQWLLSREGVSADNIANDSLRKDKFNNVPISFKETIDAAARPCVVSHLLGTILLDLSNALRYEIRGGILAEEMGLGKTVELIALICLHKRDKYPEFQELRNRLVGSFPVISGSTLIITPPSILYQWKTEIATHAPHLRVHHYQGVSSRYYNDEDLSNLVQDLLQYDVVLSTYNVLAREIWYATPIPNRSLRHEKKFKQRRSPLVQINWWRVCLDEAQMVEGGVSNAAIVARSIPRHNAWAITGTPLRRDHKDIFGLFLFLRLEPYAGSSKIWERIITELKDDFKRIIKQIALRHTKDKVRHELSIPPQTRVVMTMPFTTVEEQNYRSIFEEMCRDCSLSDTGSPLSDLWDPNDPELLEKMRKWLIRLRQICLHPSTGSRNRRAFGNISGPLRTVKEVLEVMIENNASALRSEERTLMLRKLQIGHILAFGGDDQSRAQKALKVYLEVLAQTELIIQRYQQDLIDNNYKENDDSARIGSNVEDNEDVRNQDNDQHSTIRFCARQMLEVKHSCSFFVATAYYQIRTNENITTSNSEEFYNLQKLEAEHYDLAKSIRAILLNENREKAKAYMRKISQRESLDLKSLHISYLEDYGGIESRNIFEKVNYIFKILNRQEKKMTEWRSRVQKILVTPLVDQDEEKDMTGEEYEDSTKQQDELYVLMTVLKAIVADRKFGITGQKNELVHHEIRFKAEESRLGRGDAPELFLQLAEEREELMQKNDNVSLRGLIYQLRNLRSNSQTRVDEHNERAKSEIWIIEKHMKSLQDTLTLQLRNIAELERDLDLYRTCTNLRLEFYKQLQHLSDQVAPYKEVLDEALDRRALTLAQAREEESQKIVATLKTKQRFLAHLREENLGAPVKRACVICQCQFESGILTVCGHIYCKECIQAWWREHKTCPLCKKRLHLRDFHDISYEPQELRVREEYQSSSTLQESDSVSNGHMIYSEVDKKTLNEIKSINLNGSYGTKTDMLARHLLWLRQQDKGLKSIIFSQYSDFLSLLEGAFSKFKIGFSRITQKNGIDRFKLDPAVECFLLDSKANSSGLNLVQATHVFLCEPLINTAIELQAIARVHRIGQKRPTTVYMYLISDTVEESIYRISAVRRLEHVKRTGFSSNAAAASTANGAAKGNINDKSEEPAASSSSPPSPTTVTTTTPAMQEKMLDAANSFELEHASLDKLLVKDKTGGEAVDSSDLWNCLFGNSQKQKQKQQSGVFGSLEKDLGHRFKEGED